MQPYFLPYLGYFQLIAAVDKFVVLDDVNYIRGGWINRNRLLMQGEPKLFTIPLAGASQNRRICDIELFDEDLWREKLLRTVQQAYARAPYYQKILPLLEEILHFPSLHLDSFLLNSLRQIMHYLSLQTELQPTSRLYCNHALAGEQRIIDICVREDANNYINPIGGTALYKREYFAQQDITLKFLQSRPTSYQQGKYAHISGLSIIDVLMYNSTIAIAGLLQERDLL